MTEANDNTVRLAKRLVAEHGLSRSTAEQYIEGGWVSVDGQVVELPGARRAAAARGTGARRQPVEPPDRHAAAAAKPPGYEAGLGDAAAARRAAAARARPALTLLNAQCRRPRTLPASALLRQSMCSGSRRRCPRRPAGWWSIRDKRIARKLQEDAETLEQECIVEVAGQCRRERPEEAWATA